MLKDHLEAAILLIVAVSVIPMVIEFIRARRGRTTTEAILEETGEAVEDLRDDRV